MTPSVLDETIERLIQQAVAERVAKAFPIAQQKPSAVALATAQQKSSAIAPATAQSSAVAVTPNQPSKLKAEDIGYFDPTSSWAPAPSTSATESHDHGVYTDVYDFTDRIQSCSKQWSDNNIRNLILVCLRGDALKWYSNEIHEDKKRFLVKAAYCEEWIDELIKRFKLKTSIALARIEVTTYELNEVKKGVLAQQHANNILKWTRSAEIESVKGRLTCIYMSFAHELKQDLRAPTDNITIDEYFDILTELQEVWEARAHPSRRRSSHYLKPREEPLYQTSYQYKTPYYDSNEPSPSRLPQSTTQPQATSEPPLKLAVQKSAIQIQQLPQPTTQSTHATYATSAQATSEPLQKLAVQKSAVQIQQLHQVISERANQLLAHSLQQSDNDEHHYAIAWLRYQEQQVAHKCKRCSAAFPSKNRLHSHIRECHIKTTTLSSNGTAAPHICSVTLVSASGKPSNQAAASYISATAATAIATAATATHETSTSPHAAKKTTSASKSQIASKLAANPLVPAEIAPPTSPCPEYRAISPAPPEYEPMKPQSYLTIDELYTRYAPLRCMRSSHLTIQDLYMRYAPLNSTKSSSSTRPTSSISTRSTRLTSRILSIITIKDLYKRFEKSTEKIAPNTPKCTQHSSGSHSLASQNKPAISLSANQNAAATSKLPAPNKDSTMIKRTEKFAYGAAKWTHRSLANQHVGIQEACDAKTSDIKSFLDLKSNANITQRSTEKNIISTANQTPGSRANQHARISSIDLFQASKMTAKTRFMTMANAIHQGRLPQQQVPQRQIPRRIARPRAGRRHPPKRAINPANPAINQPDPVINDVVLRRSSRPRRIRTRDHWSNSAYLPNLNDFLPHPAMRAFLFFRLTSAPFNFMHAIAIAIAIASAMTACE